MNSDIINPVLSRLSDNTDENISHIFAQTLEMELSYKILYIKISVLKLEATKFIG